MSQDGIAHLIACQDALLAALDARDIDAIEQATADVARATSMLNAGDAWRDGPGIRQAVDHGLRQNDAARMRVNIMSEWTRRRSDRLAELRGQASAHVYRPRTA